MESSSDSSLVHLKVDDYGVAILRLNRPEKRNALSQKLIDALISAIAIVERDEKVKAVVLAGGRTTGPFSAGADLSELVNITTSEAHQISYLKDLADAVTNMRKPTICVVTGYALGGGFELALMCDLIYAAEDAKFGLPELSVGTIPGAGGTQRLTRLIGRQKAMHMILTSETVSGKELEALGGIAKSWPVNVLLEESLAVARKIAGRSVPVAGLAKEAIRNAEQTSLDTGLKLERGLYYASFSLKDRTEGMKAFIEKRQPSFEDR